MPTRAGITTAVFAVAFLVAGRVFGIFELYVVATAMLALIACASMWVLLNWRSLQVRRMVDPARLHAGSISTVTLNLSNSRLVPMFRRFDVIATLARTTAFPPRRADVSKLGQ